jgi:hypothetical protein
MPDEIIVEAKAGIAGVVVGIVEGARMKAFEGLLLSDPSKMDSNIQGASG